MKYRICDELKRGIKKGGIIAAGAGALGITSALIGAGLYLTGLAIYFPTQTASELFMNKSKHEYIATLTKKECTRLVQTKMILCRGDFETADGKNIGLYDTPRILEGKIWANSVLGNLKEGIEYKVTSIGSEKNQTILDAKLQ